MQEVSIAEVRDILDRYDAGFDDMNCKYMP